MGNMAEELVGTAADTRPMQKWRWVSYDLWSDGEGGFTVNDSWKTDTFYEIPEGASDEEILKIVGCDDGEYEVDDSADFGDNVVEFRDTKTGSPAGRIEREED